MKISENTNKVINLLMILEKREIEYIENYISSKLQTVNTKYVENSKLTETELDFINNIMKQH